MTLLLKYISALAFLYFVLVLPDWPGNLVSYSFMRLPIELPILMLVLASAPSRSLTWLHPIIVLVMTVVVVLKIANLITFEFYARPFNILVDPGLISTVINTIIAGRGMGVAFGVIVAAITIIILVAVLLWFAVGALRPVRSLLSLRNTGIVAGIALLAAIPLADFKINQSWWNVTSLDTSLFARERALSVVEGLKYDAAFRAKLSSDSYADIPVKNLLAKLRGTDVLLVFVEAYGRAALDSPIIAESIRPVLKNFESALLKHNFYAESAWITSPTFGGQSWLSHSTFVTGLWVDNQRRYESLFISDRKTLIHDFSRGGWRTVGVMPQIAFEWPEGKYFGYEKVYSASDLGYAGPRFDYVTMPDQYTLSTFHQRELASRERAPVMAEIALVSSHLPWTPLPKIVAWEEVKNGEIFFKAKHPLGSTNLANSNHMRTNYVQAISYELEVLKSFITKVLRENTLMIILGDHQPVPVVSGTPLSYDVPVHIISSDPKLLEAIKDWGWTTGMIPTEESPTWRMDVMRKRILESFTSGGAQVTVSIDP